METMSTSQAVAEGFPGVSVVPGVAVTRESQGHLTQVVEEEPAPPHPATEGLPEAPALLLLATRCPSSRQ